ncbi:MAG TPA: hypothetical protein VMI35_07960 [Puia sp.]|nr:hypothetical protein [Puia sp.]
MKTTNLFRLTLLAASMGLVFACNKSNMNNNGSGSNNGNADLQTQADDEAQVSNEDEAITNDANTALYNQPSTAGSGTSSSMGAATTTVMGAGEQTAINGAGGPILNLICDASVVVDTANGNRTITITYNGTNCWGNRTRTGVVVISIPEGVYWRNPGATVTLNIQNLKITRLSDGKTITLNGTKTITNVSGGLLVDLATLGSITHTISGSLSITFNNGKQRVWNVSKERVFSYNNGIVITTTGTHTDSLGNSDVAEWGVNRFGTAFESLISQPKVIRQDCDFRLVSGQNTILRSDDISTVITYGLDANGDPTGCPGSGTYYLKAVVTFPNGTVFTKILPY